MSFNVCIVYVGLYYDYPGNNITATTLRIWTSKNRIKLSAIL